MEEQGHKEIKVIHKPCRVPISPVDVPWRAEGPQNQRAKALMEAEAKKNHTHSTESWKRAQCPLLTPQQDRPSCTLQSLRPHILLLLLLLLLLIAIPDTATAFPSIGQQLGVPSHWIPSAGSQPAPAKSLPQEGSAPGSTQTTTFSGAVHAVQGAGMSPMQHPTHCRGQPPGPACASRWISPSSGKGGSKQTQEQQVYEDALQLPMPRSR